MGQRPPADRKRLTILFAVVAGFLSLLPATAQEQGQEPAGSLAAAAAPAGSERLRRLSIEELMEIDVTSVSKRSEPLSRAAAAITVLTREDLRRSGATSLQGALRLANGLHIAQQSATDWGITARGFNITTANKLLVLIDGRSVYTPLFSGVFWDVQDVMLEDVDRIEIIRGPGATLWGANAVNGVINIITRGAADTQGGLLSVAAGNEERLVAGSRYGGQLGEQGHYRVYGKHTDRDALALPDGRDAGDPIGFSQGGFRADWAQPGAGEAGAAGAGDAVGNGLTLQGDLYDGDIGRRVGADIEVDGGNLLGRWSRRLAGGSDLTVQAYFDRTHRLIPGTFEEDRDTWDLDVQHHLQPGARHNVVWGFGYRTTRDRIGNSAAVAFLPDRRSVDLANVFAQDEVSLLDDRLRLTLGAKLEHHESTGLEPQPSVRLAWTPGEDQAQSFWGAISRAVRAPTRLDEDIVFFRPDGQVLTRGDRGFESEKLVAYELGWRSRINEGLSVDVSTFLHDYDDLRSQERTDGGLPIVLANRLEGETYGAEIRGNLDLTEGWRLHAAYSYLGKDLRLEPGSTDPTGGRNEGNDPRHRFLVRSQIDLADDLELDFNLRHVDDLPFPRVPSYTELDLHLGWQATDRLELSLIGTNLLNDRHPELGSPAVREEVERSVYGRVLWTF